MHKIVENTLEETHLSCGPDPSTFDFFMKKSIKGVALTQNSGRKIKFSDLHQTLQDC